MQPTVPKINTDGISDEEKATPKFQSFYQGMMAKLSQPEFIPALCAHEAAHLFFLAAMGMTEYDPHPASIRYDPAIDDYVGDMAGVKPIEPSPWQKDKFQEWFTLLGCALAAGGVVARKLDPTTDGGDEDDWNRFKALCGLLNQTNPTMHINFEEAWMGAQIRFKVQMDEPVAQRARHREMDSTLRCRIAGCDDYPAVGQHILAELPVQHQLIAARLGHLRRGGQFIKKEDAFACGGEKLGRHPFRLIRCNSREAAQINRVKLHGPYVEKVIV